MKYDGEFLATRSDWIFLLASSILISLIAIPIHELGHVIGYRLTGVAARVAYEHTTLPSGAAFNFSGTVCGVFSTYIASYLGIVLIYRKKWLPLSYPLAVILSLVRIGVYMKFWIQFHKLAGLDESQLASFTGLHPYFWYVVCTILFIVVWILIFRSLRYGLLRNVLLCAIPVFLFMLVSTSSLFVVAKYFPQTASNTGQMLRLSGMEPMSLVCRHNSVRQQIQAVKAGGGVDSYTINPNS